jgi:MFS family permease
MIHNKGLNPAKIKWVSAIACLFGFADAFLVYVLSSYFQSVIGTDFVSFFYLGAYGVVLVTLLYLHEWVRKVGKSMLLFLLLIGTILTNALLVFFAPSFFTLFVLLLHIVCTNLIWVSIDIILESFSEDGNSGRIRGLYLMIVNMGWLLAPILSTKLLMQSGFPAIFFVGLVLYSVILIVALLSLRRVNYRFKEKITPKQIFKKIKKRKDILSIYAIAFAVEFFYAVMLVYSPLYLLKIGFDWSAIGVMFTIMLIPFVVVQYPLGILADKRFGEKEMLILCLVLMLLSTAFLPFIGTKSLMVWAGALLLTRIGAAGADILRDSYFYKRIDADDVDIIAFFRTARPVANITSAGAIGASLFFLPLSSVFFIASGVLFLGLIPAVALVDNQSERDLL